MGENALDIIKQIDDTIREAERLVRQTDEFYKDLGLSRGVAKQFMLSEAVSPDQRDKMNDELDKWEQEVFNEISNAVDVEKQQRNPNRLKPKKLMNLRHNRI